MWQIEESVPSVPEEELLSELNDGSPGTLHHSIDEQVESESDGEESYGDYLDDFHRGDSEDEQKQSLKSSHAESIESIQDEENLVEKILAEKVYRHWRRVVCARREKPKQKNINDESKMPKPQAHLAVSVKAASVRDANFQSGSFYLKPVLASSVAEIEPTEASVSKPVLASSVLDRHIEAAQKALLVSSVRDCAHTEALKSSGVFEVPDDSGINVTPQHLHLGMLARRQADNQVGQVLTQIGRCLGGLLYRQAGKIVAQFCEMWRM
jgi:hypothetical protein